MKSQRLSSREGLSAIRLSFKEGLESGRSKIKLCCGTACRATGSLKVLSALKSELAKNGPEVDIVTTGCQGLCQKGPLMRVEPQGYFYQRVKASHVPSIVGTTLNAGFPVRELLFKNTIVDKPSVTIDDVPF